MSRIHQIQVQFDPVQDRCLLRFRTGEQAEFNFWLTRRFVKALWSGLLGLLGSSANVRDQLDDQARATVLSFQHESAISKSDFETPYQPAAQTPLGADPLLLVRATARNLHDGNHVLSLHAYNGQGIDVTLDGVLAHSLTKLIADAARRADWELPLTLGDPAAASDENTIN